MRILVKDDLKWRNNRLIGAKHNQIVVREPLEISAHVVFGFSFVLRFVPPEFVIIFEYNNDGGFVCRQLCIWKRSCKRLTKFLQLNLYLFHIGNVCVTDTRKVL